MLKENQKLSLSFSYFAFILLQLAGSSTRCVQLHPVLLSNTGSLWGNLVRSSWYPLGPAHGHLRPFATIIKLSIWFSFYFCIESCVNMSIKWIENAKAGSSVRNYALELR